MSSISPKIEIAGVSIGSEIKTQKSQELVTNSLKLINGLHRSKSIQPISKASELERSTFYHSIDNWHSGLFYFKSGFPKGFAGLTEEIVYGLTVAYLLWTTYENSIILLVGSPANILGEKIVRDGILVQGTSGALSDLMNFVEILKTDEPENFMIQHMPGTLIAPEELRLASEPYVYERYEEAIELPNLDTDSLRLAIFCLYYLRNLPQSHIDTVFRVFSQHKSSKRDYHSDLIEEYRHLASREITHSTKWKSILQFAEKANLEKYNTVYIGSPVYTAIE